jgi:hypothetical protein
MEHFKRNEKVPGFMALVADILISAGEPFSQEEAQELGRDF